MSQVVRKVERMDIILVSGFWLDASSWDEVTPSLTAAGHTVHPMTLPGLESRDSDRSEITLRDHIDAVVDKVDSLDGKVVLVGHSGGGAIIYAVTDVRPDRVARAIYVDTGPLGPGGVINDELPEENGEVPLPDWSIFEDEDLIDLTDDLRAAFRARAIPQPARVASDKQELSDDPRRFVVPSTIIACEFSSAMLTEFIANDHPFTKELAKVKDIDLVDLPTGHWPQFTKPAKLGEVILLAVEKAAAGT